VTSSAYPDPGRVALLRSLDDITAEPDNWSVDGRRLDPDQRAALTRITKPDVEAVCALLFLEGRLGADDYDETVTQLCRGWPNRAGGGANLRRSRPP